MKKEIFKIDKRVNYRVIIDTETLMDGNVYNIGITITNNKGREVYGNEWIVKETFQNFNFNNFYSNNKNYYQKQLKYYKSLKQTPLEEIRKQIKSILKKFKNYTVWAYNACFDYKHLNDTYKKICRKNKPFINAKWKDIMSIAKEYIHKSAKYKAWCKKNNFFTPKGYIPFNAEKMYAYLSNDPNFKEDHTALSDTKIEGFILNKLLQKHLKISNCSSLYKDEIQQIKYMYDCLTNYTHTEKYIIEKFNLK